jgi:hypothetical protein
MIDETNLTATGGQAKHMHDLITRIDRRCAEQERDMRNLNNLFHACLGTGIRSPEFAKEDREYEMKVL